PFEGMARSFRELIWYQLACQLRRNIFVIVSTPSFNCDLSLRGQLRRASASVCSNIAEGFGRTTHADFAHFLDISRSSTNEIDDRLDEALESGYLTPADVTDARGRY